MKKRNKRQIYEAIMRDVAKTIKRHLNENNQDEELLIKFIHDNKSFKNYEIPKALGEMDEYRVPLYQASDNINNNIYELIHEFAEEYDLSKEWTDNFNIEQIFYKYVNTYADEIWNKNDDSYYDDMDAWDEYVDKYDLDPGDENYEDDEEW